MSLIDLKEILPNPEILTNFMGIQLRSNWQLNFTGWTLVPNLRHKDDCKIHTFESLADVEIENACDCSPEVYMMLVSKILAYPKGEPKREYHQCTLTEYPADIRLAKDSPEKFVNEQDDFKLSQLINQTATKDWPLILWEDLQNGLETIIHFIKYNEATGKVLTEQDLFEGKKEMLDIIYDKN